MRLFHVSYEHVKSFTPRIPECRLAEEDSVTPRICFSDSIERCINAKPNQADAIYHALRIGFPIWVWVYSINVSAGCKPASLLSPTEVLQAGVMDALQNHEYWLTKKPDVLQERCFEITNAEFLPQRLGERFHRIQSIGLHETDKEKSYLSEKLLAQAMQKAGMKHFTPDVVICELAEQYPGELKKLFTLAKGKSNGE